jgi:hypothetical protein
MTTRRNWTEDFRLSLLAPFLLVGVVLLMELLTGGSPAVLFQLRMYWAGLARGDASYIVTIASIFVLLPLISFAFTRWLKRR